MSAEQAPALDRAALLAAFVDHDAKFVIVGGVASQVYGATRVTKDLDLCPAWSAENLERVAAALRDLGAWMKIGEGSIELLEVALDAKTLANMEIVPWRTRAGDLDVLLGIPSASRFELVRYEQLVANATIIEVDGLQVAVASLADIIRSKEIADRPKDREALQELRLIERRWPRATGLRSLARPHDRTHAKLADITSPSRVPLARLRGRRGSRPAANELTIAFVASSDRLAPMSLATEASPTR